MSREDLKSFLHAVNHSSALRRSLKESCNKDLEIIQLAKEYGFNITTKDLEDDMKFEVIRLWFKSSVIEPIKKF